MIFNDVIALLIAASISSIIAFNSFFIFEDYY